MGVGERQRYILATANGRSRFLGRTNLRPQSARGAVRARVAARGPVSAWTRVLIEPGGARKFAGRRNRCARISRIPRFDFNTPSVRAIFRRGEPAAGARIEAVPSCGHSLHPARPQYPLGIDGPDRADRWSATHRDAALSALSLGVARRKPQRSGRPGTSRRDAGQCRVRAWVRERCRVVAGDAFDVLFSANSAQGRRCGAGWPAAR